MAPEQRRDARNVDGRADLYSLGVILYEALTGDLPSGRFALPSERIRGLPRVVDAVVLKLLESEPERRHPDANAAAAAIEESLLQTSGKSLRRSAPPGARKWGWAGAAGGLGAAALLVAGVALVLGRGAAAAPRSVRLAAEVKRPAADRVQVAFGVAGPDKSPGPVYAVGGGWRAEDGVLYRSSSRGSVEAETTRAPRAYLTAFRADFADAQIEVEASLGEGGVAGEAPAADLVLYRDRARWVGVVVSLGEDSGYALAWPGGSAEGAGKAEEPQPGRVVKLGLRLKGQKAAALVDGRVVATATVPALAGVKGKVGVGCRAARCSFHGLEVRGPILEPPAREALP
jgi:serine/threonine-protein kinase